jgi:hypothetical protein
MGGAAEPAATEQHGPPPIDLASRRESMRKTIAMAAALILVGLSVTGCRDHPGYPSDRRGHHDQAHDHDHYR